tara:strand:+ start:630 stop:809 length:180 start_codon:yes stop_codon:yes gene_type:complete
MNLETSIIILLAVFNVIQFVIIGFQNWVIFLKYEYESSEDNTETGSLEELFQQIKEELK